MLNKEKSRTTAGTKKKEQNYEMMPVLNEHAAGIDVGSREHYVAVGQGKEHVKKFGVYTSHLQELCNWLLEKGVKTVALESTGNYWKNLFMMLMQHGLNPILVNGSFTKNLKGRKTDVQDCQFIQRMHTLGLLPDSFQPDDFTEQLRNLARHRCTLVSQAAYASQRMQQSLRLMNVRLDVAISDITGKSGMKIIHAILDGERNAQTLAGLCDVQVKKPKEEIAEALNGFWRQDYLFQLRQQLGIWQLIQKQIQEVDSELNRLLEEHLEQSKKNELHYDRQKNKPKKKQKNNPSFDIEKKSYQLFNGVDLMQIPGISHNTMLSFISEMGENIGKFRSAKAFCSWLRLAPNKKKSGGKVISNKIKQGTNLLAVTLRSAANTIGNMKADLPITKFFKRLAYKYGRAAAITGTARKLAVIIWNMITRQQPYQPISNEQYDSRIRKITLINIQKKITKLKIKPEDLKFAIADF
jgi:transposase